MTNTETQKVDTNANNNSTTNKAPSSSYGFGNAPLRPKNKRTRRPQQKDTRARPEFEQKILSIRRVTRVASGGRRFSFSVAMAAGNRKGDVGVGIGKGSDTAVAIEKAFRDAKKNMVRVHLNKDKSIAHFVEAKFKSSSVTMRPSKGQGLVAGSSVRSVLELAGIKDVSAKLMTRSKNRLNNARVAIETLKKLRGTKDLRK